MKPVLVFDIETIPDVAGLRRLNDLPAGLSDDEVAELAFQQRRAKTGNDFLQLHLQRIVMRHPRTGERLELVDPLPIELATVLERLRASAAAPAADPVG